MIRRTTVILLNAGLCAATRVPSNLANVPLSFERNVGQADDRVVFLAHSGARTIYLTKSGFDIAGIDLTFRGGKCAAMSGVQPLSERHNYFRGSSSGPQAFTDVPTYGRVRCEGIYPGINAEFYGNAGALEYDLIISPHIDLSVVSLQWKYANSVRLDQAGDLIVDGPRGVLRQYGPVVYQVSKGERGVVDGKYVLSGKNAARLSLGAYNPDLPLIIDPVVFAVDANAAPAGSMAVDSSGNIYLAGTTGTSSFETTEGSLQPSLGGGTCSSQAGTMPPYYFPCPDAYVIKLSANGAVIYATYLGGDGNDAADAIAVDSSGNVYVAGTTGPNSSNTNNFPITSGAAFSKPSADGTDAFVAKLNANGDRLVYSTFVPDIYQLALAVDSQGAAYIAGLAFPAGVLRNSSGFPATPGAFQTTSTVMGATGGVAKLNANGTALVYATFLGGSNPNNYADPDGATGIAVDSAGNAFVTGWTLSPDFPTTFGAFNANPQIASVYVAKLNAAGSGLIYSTLLGEGAGIGIRIDAKENAYILGETESSAFPVTPGAFQPSGPDAPWAVSPYYPGLSGQTLSALNASGSALIYSTYLKGAAVLDVDAAGDAFVAGVASYNFPVTNGAFQRCVTNGTGDLFVIEFNPAGQAIASTYLGGSGVETPSAIVAASNGSPYIAGTTASTDFPGIVGAANGVPLSFVTRIQIDNPETPDGPCVSQILQNAASLVDGSVVPGEIVTIHGVGIGPLIGVSGEAGPDGVFPTQLAGVQVSFDGKPAPLLYVQDRQINTVVPWGVAMDFNAVYYGTTQVSVQVDGVTANMITNRLTDAAPGIFGNSATKQAAVLNQDGTPNSPSNPAARGSIVAIYATGGGTTNPPGQTGTVSPLRLAPLTLPVTVQIGGEDCYVVYAGAAPGLISGMMQVNVSLPEILQHGSFDISITVGSANSPMNLAIAVQ